METTLTSVQSWPGPQSHPTTRLWRRSLFPGIWISALFLALLGVGACSDDSSSGGSDTVDNTDFEGWTPETSGGDTSPDVGEPTDSQADSQADGTADTGLDSETAPVTVDFEFITRNGAVGLGLTALTLTADDEVPNYATQPELQFDVRVHISGATTRDTVTLELDRVTIGTQPLIPPPGSTDATTQFVALILGGPTHVVRVVHNSGVAISKTVTVEITPCDVELTPTPESCVSTDVDPELVGVQTTFLVHHTQKRCTEAQLTVQTAVGTVLSPKVPLDESGQALITVTVSQDAGPPNGVTARVSATVSHPRYPERTSTTNAATYTVDQIAPVITLTAPIGPGLTYDDDIDPVEPGIQALVSGNVDPTDVGAAVVVLKDGLVAAETEVSQDGTFVVTVGFTTTQTHTITINVTDACGNVGTAETTLPVVAQDIALAIIQPENGVYLLAKDDLDPETETAFDTVMVVAHQPALSNTQLLIQCRSQANKAIYLTLAQLELTAETIEPSGLYSLPVTVDLPVYENPVSCRAIVLGSVQKTSADVTFQVGLPQPVLSIAQPGANEKWKSANQPGLLVGQGLDGVTPTWVVMSEVGDTVVTTPPAPAFAAGIAPISITLVDADGKALPDGHYTLTTAAEDGFGNAAADNPQSMTKRTFLLDTTAPKVTIVSPEEGEIPVDVDPSTPGVQIVVNVQVTDSGPPLPGKVCVVELPDSVAVCEQLAAFPALMAPVTVTLQPGDNALMAIATDSAGNEGKTQRTVTLATGATKVQVLSPKSLSVLTTPTVSVAASITPLIGLAMADLQLWFDGTPVAILPTVTGPNIVTFADVPITDGAHTVQVVVTLENKTGASAIVPFSKKSITPAVTISPVPTPLTLNSAQCLGGVSDCWLDIAATTTAVEDGQPAQLEVLCGNLTPKVYNTVITNSHISWSNVVLADSSLCTMTATVVDATGVAVSSPKLTVTVDRTRPVLHGFTSPNNVILQYNTDENVFIPGMQKSITVNLSGVEQGQLLQVFGQTDNSLPFLIAQSVIPKDVPMASSLTLSLGQQTLPDGVLALKATLSDKAGNPAHPIGKLVLVVSNQPTVSLLGPNYVAPAACATDSNCPMGAICISGACAVNWNADAVREVLVEMTGVSIGNNVIKVCSNAPGLSGPQCTKSGYRQIVSKPVNASLMAIDVSSLPDGLHTIMVEAETLEASGIWVQSTDNPTEAYQTRRIWVDTVKPVVGSLLALSDTLAPTGVLSLAEQTGNKSFLFYVGGAEDGLATLYVDGLPRASQPLTEGAAQIPVQFNNDGPKLIQATITDLAKNTSALTDSPTLSLHVAQIPPVAKFVAPAESLINKATWAPLEISAPDTTLVTVFDKGQPMTPPLAPQGGVLTNATLMADGTHEFTAEVVDFAGNKTVIATNPKLVVVDTLAPTLTLVTPTSGALTDGDDVSPAGGFQVAVVFETAGAQTFSVSIASGCTNTYTSCAPPTLLSTGTVLKDGVQPVLTLTIPAATQFHVLSVTTVDMAGNPVTATAKLSLELSACTVALVGLPPDGVLNQSDCPNATPCNAINAALTALVTGPCGSIDTVSLYLDGVPTAQDNNAADYEAALPTTFTDGTVGVLELIVTHQGKIVTTSGTIPLLVDLSPPVVTFVSKTVAGFLTPATGETVVWGKGADQSPDQPQLQVHVALSVTDAGPIGGTLSPLQWEKTTGPEPIPALGLPSTIGAWPFQKDVLFVTLPHGAQGKVIATAYDSAGNMGTTSFTMTVDMLPPDAPNLLPLNPEDTVPRMPAITLRFAPPADDAGLSSSGPAAQLDVRYSRSPITTEAHFLAACKAENIPGGLPTPDVLPPGVGLLQEVVISGPDPRPTTVEENGNLCKFVTLADNSPYWFAVRAKDAAGNLSPFVTASTTSTTDLRFRYATITTNLTAPQPINFQRTVANIGDVNGDGFADVALGGQGSHGFCIVFGHDGADDGFWENLTIDSSEGLHHQCILDPTPTGAGSNISALGDANGDGIDDFVVAAGFVDAVYPEQARIYLGSASGKITTVPALTVTGTKNGYVYGPQLGGGGNFNGDAHPVTKAPIKDLIVASRSENKAYIIPGATLWPKATCNLLDAGDRTAFNVVTLSVPDADSQAGFAYRVGFVGNILPSVFGTFDEAYVTQSKGITQVYVIPGRPVSGGLSLAYSQAGGGSQPDDDDVVRLRPEMGIVTATFGADVRGGVDIDNDQVPDILANHPSDKKLYLFSGAALKNKLGLIVRTETTAADVYGEGMLLGKNGVVMTGAWSEPCWLGNFDGDDKITDGTPDLVYGVYDLFAATYGKVWVRLNTDPAGDGWFGSFPYVDVTFQSPIPMKTPTALGSTIRCPGDINGDGFPDIVVGTNGEGWALTIQ